MHYQSLSRRQTPEDAIYALSNDDEDDDDDDDAALFVAPDSQSLLCKYHPQHCDEGRLKFENLRDLWFLWFTS